MTAISARSSTKWIKVGFRLLIIFSTSPPRPQVLVCYRYYHNIPPFRDKVINGELSFRYSFSLGAFLNLNGRKVLWFEGLLPICQLVVWSLKSVVEYIFLWKIQISPNHLQSLSGRNKFHTCHNYCSRRKNIPHNKKKSSESMIAFRRFAYVTYFFLRLHSTTQGASLSTERSRRKNILHNKKKFRKYDSLPQFRICDIFFWDCTVQLKAPRCRRERHLPLELPLNEQCR